MATRTRSRGDVCRTVCRNGLLVVPLRLKLTMYSLPPPGAVALLVSLAALHDIILVLKKPGELRMYLTSYTTKRHLSEHRWPTHAAHNMASPPQNPNQPSYMPTYVVSTPHNTSTKSKQPVRRRLLHFTYAVDGEVEAGDRSITGVRAHDRFFLRKGKAGGTQMGQRRPYSLDMAGVGG